MYDVHYVFTVHHMCTHQFAYFLRSKLGQLTHTNTHTNHYAKNNCHNLCTVFYIFLLHIIHMFIAILEDISSSTFFFIYRPRIVISYLLFLFRYINPILSRYSNSLLIVQNYKKKNPIYFPSSILFNCILSVEEESLNRKEKIIVGLRQIFYKGKVNKIKGSN